MMARLGLTDEQLRREVDERPGDALLLAVALEAIARGEERDEATARAERAEALVSAMTQPLLATNGLPPGVTPGDWNHAPSPIEEISEDEYWHRGGGVGTSEFHQYYNLPGHLDKTLKTVYIYWKADCGIAVAPPQTWRGRTEADGPGHSIIYTEPPHYYYIGCRHEDRSVKTGRCLYLYTCQKCGRTLTVDAGD